MKLLTIAASFDLGITDRSMDNRSDIWRGIDTIKAEEAAEKAMAEDLLSKFEVQLGLKSPETTPVAETVKSLGPAIQKTSE